MSCANAASPLQMVWGNVTVTPDGQSVSRGFEVGIGSPPQVLSLRPSINDNNLWVMNVANCVSKNNDTCVAPAGGVYAASNSSTYAQAIEAQWNGTHDNNINDGSYIFFNDDLQFASGANGTVAGYPAFMDQPGYGSQGGLPLGPNSTFLETAVANGAAPNRAFGLWTGTRNVQQPVDGLLVVGGYDTARVSGQPTSYATYSNCATCPQVTNITYTTPQGPVSLFANSSQTMFVSLEPFERSLYIPQDMFDRFTNISGGRYDPDLELIAYPAANPPTGNLTVTLNGGYKTVIPASELFAPPRGYNSQGQYVVNNDSWIIAEFQNGSNPKYVPSWGIPYLTMNYLIVDYDNAKFSLAPAIRDNFGDNAAIVTPLCSGIATASSSPTALASTSASAFNSASATPTSSPTPAPAKTGHSSDTGAIVGGVVGGVLGLALIGVLLFFFLRRGRNRNTQNSQPQPPSTQDRMSQYTSPTEVSEWQSPQPKYDHPVNSWLHGQAQPQPQMQPMQQQYQQEPMHQQYQQDPMHQQYQQDPITHGYHNYAQPHDEVMSPTMNRPFEMPVHGDL